MFEDLLIGPICVVYTPIDRVTHLNEIDKNGYIPLLELTKGSLFEDIKRDVPNGSLRAKSIIISIAYTKLYN